MSDISKIFMNIGVYLKMLFYGFKEWYDIANKFVDDRPSIVGVLVHAVVWVAIIGIFASLIFAIMHNIKTWKPKPNSHLMYSYFAGTGQYQWHLIYKEAFKLLYDHKWWSLSFAGSAYWIGNIELQSKVISFVLSLAYIPLTVLGFFEMVFRRIIGTIWIYIFAFIHGVILFVISLTALLILPIFKLIDKSNRNVQHCSNCYYEFDLPQYTCPHCGVKHKDLSPSKTGELFARCECGKFISPFILAGKSKYEASCPNCDELLGASNIKQFSIQIIGGNDTGKTAFLAAFQHIVMNAKNSLTQATLYGYPQNVFELLEQTYESGITESSSETEVGVATIIYGENNSVKQSGLLFYDIPDEVILSDSYQKNPLNFIYSNGIVIIIDPLNFDAVRERLKKDGKDIALIGSSEDNPEELIIDFINQYSKIVGRAANRMVSVPLAVVINKTDVDIVYNEIGNSVIKKVFDTDPIRYNNNPLNAMSEICRNYLEKNGMTNAINHLESTFSNICYFSISAIGHESKDGLAFKPNGVIEPILWLMQKENGDFRKIFDALGAYGG